MTQRADTFAFGGGLDTNSAALAVAPGALISGINYEALAEGYGRCQGYERFDGRPAPSSAEFWSLAFKEGVTSFSYGDVVTGGTSGATGVLVVNLPYGFSGSWGDGTAAGVLVLTDVEGAFIDGETLNVAATTHAVADGAAAFDSAPTPALAKAWLEAAQAWRRTRIAKVPGEGPVRGVAVHAGEVFAWRDTIGATALRCYRATAMGWVAVATLHRIAFTAGTNAILDGNTITGATSGATAQVLYVSEVDGSWGSGTAAGFLIVKAVTGSFAAETIKVGGTNCATIDGAVTAQYASPGGRVRWISHNFYGAADQYRLYGTNGTGPAFELYPADGMALIATGMTNDKPERVFEIGNTLGLVFPGGSIQNSATANPQSFAAVLGAAEIGFGTNVTDVIQANETAVAIFGEQKIGILQGHDASDFQLDILTEEAGADADSAQRIARTVYLDRRGLRSLDATQMYGNFKAGSLSGKFERYFRSKRAAGAAVVGSYVSRTKSQYRLVWDDGTGLSVYMGGKEPEAIPFSFGFTPFSFGAGELDGGEAIFIGGADGYVYRIDSGNSWDGQPIKGFVMTGFNGFGAPQMDDRFHKVTLELDGPDKAHIGIAVQYDYGDGYQPNSNGQDFVVSGGGGNWDAAIWNEFFWSAAVEGRAECWIDGIGRNASFIFATTAGLNEDPHILQAYIVHRSARRFRR